MLSPMSELMPFVFVKMIFLGRHLCPHWSRLSPRLPHCSQGVIPSDVVRGHGINGGQALRSFLDNFQHVILVVIRVQTTAECTDGGTLIHGFHEVYPLFEPPYVVVQGFPIPLDDRFQGHRVDVVMAVGSKSSEKSGAEFWPRVYAPRWEFAIPFLGVALERGREHATDHVVVEVVHFYLLVKKLSMVIGVLAPIVDLQVRPFSCILWEGG